MSKMTSTDKYVSSLMRSDETSVQVHCVCMCVCCFDRSGNTIQSIESNKIEEKS